MAGSARVHVHTVRKRSLCHSVSAQSRLLQHRIPAETETAAVVVDDDDNKDAAQAQVSPEVSMPKQWSPRLQARKRSKPLTFPTQEERTIDPFSLLAQLSVVQLPTSGHSSRRETDEFACFHVR